MMHVSCVRGGAKWGPSPVVFFGAVVVLLGVQSLPWALRPLACLVLALAVGAHCVQGGRVELEGHVVRCTASSFLAVSKWSVEAREIVAVITTDREVLVRTSDGSRHVLARGLTAGDAAFVAQRIEAVLHE